MNIQHVLLVLVIYFIFRFFIRRNIRARCERISVDAQDVAVEFPLVLSYRPWSRADQRKSLIAVALVVFPFFAIIGFGILIFLGKYLGIETESKRWATSALFGAVATILSALQFPELKRINETMGVATKGRELIFENSTLKIARNISADPYPANEKDEGDYYVIPLGSFARVKLDSVEQRHGRKYFYQIGDRNFTLWCDRLAASEATFVAALKRSGVQTTGF